MSNLTDAFLMQEYTTVIPGEPVEINSTRHKMVYVVPLLSKETGRKFHYFSITYYDRTAQSLEFGTVIDWGEPIVSYFELYDPMYRKIHRRRIQNDKETDMRSLQSLLDLVYIKLEIPGVDVAP